MHYKRYKTILSAKNGMNIYRGCSHGCIYCDSRSTCYQMKHDFEDIEIKENAAAMLIEELKKRRKKCMIGTGAMTDPYTPIEKEIGYTRDCLEAIYKYGFGLAIQTKSNAILRDLDIIDAINKKTKAVVQMTLTTYDEKLCKIVEPYVSSTQERIEVLNIMRDRNIPTVAWLSPFLPFINDTEENIVALLNACVNAKVKAILCFGIGLTLRDGNREYFYKQLDINFPGLKEKYMKKFGYSYECRSDNHDKLMRIIINTCKANDILYKPKDIFEYMNTFESKEYGTQLSLF